MLNCDPPRQGVIVLRPFRRIKFGPQLNCDPGSRFHVELWPQVLIPRWMLTPSHYSTLNYDPRLGSQFNVELWPGVMIQRGILTRGHNSTLKCDPRSWVYVELLPRSIFHVENRCRVMILRWKVTPGLDSTLKYICMTLGLNSTLNCDPESWLNVELWPGLGITIQRWFVTRGHNSTWNFDPGSQINVEFWPVYISSTRGIATQEDGVNIQ